MHDSDFTAMMLSMTSADEKREKFIRMPFSYPGSKAGELDNILPHLPYRGAYAEPFGGSGVVLLNRRPSRIEVFNDRYAGVTALFQVVRDPKLYEQFMKRVTTTIHSREEFIWCKTTWKDPEDLVERAARWYYMARFAVNGKTKSTFGRTKDSRYKFADRLLCSLPLFGKLHYRFQNVTFENLDWRLLIEDFDKPDMVWYMDPTYLDSYKGAYEHELSIDDHKELVARVQSLSGFVAISSFDGPETRSVYDKAGIWTDKISWTRTNFANIQAFTETNFQTEDRTRNRTTEILWIRDKR